MRATPPVEDSHVPPNHIHMADLRERKAPNNDDRFNHAPEYNNNNKTMTKILWMYWDKGFEHLESLSHEPTNKYAVDFYCVKAMYDLNPTWDIRFLNERSAELLAPIYTSLLKNESLYSQMTPTMKGDTLRLELLSRYGGVYADTSICPREPLDKFIPEWLGTEEKDGFWAFPKDSGFSNVASFAKRSVDKCHDHNKLPSNHSAKGTQGNKFRTSSNWFIASSHPHNPLIDEWLRLYVNHLRTLSNPSEPYFLAHCSLSQARMYNRTVDEIWSSTLKRYRLAKRKACEDSGGSSCVIIKKPQNQYVLSGRYMNDLHHGYIPPHPPFEPLKHVSHTCTLSNGERVHIPVAVPHLILIGTQKGGTGTLQELFKLSPNVILPRKAIEIDFMDEKVVRRTSNGHLNETDEGELCRLRKEYADEYKMDDIISMKDKAVIAFEKTPHYMLRSTIPKAIDIVCPHKPKILVTLRNPIDRAFSQYSMVISQGGHLSPNTTFEEAIEHEVGHLIQRGLLKDGTLTLSEYKERRNEFDFTMKNISPILTYINETTLEKYAEVTSKVLMVNETVDGAKYDGDEVIRPNHFTHILFRGIYALQLVPWVQRFGAAQRIMILRFEDFAGDDANQTKVQEDILSFAGISNPILKDQKRQVKRNSFKKTAEMDSVTEEYLKWLYQPFNDLLPAVLGDEWLGAWDWDEEQTP